MHEVFNYINLQFYYLQQYINTTLIYNLNHATLLIFVLIFIGGAFTSINPCMISVLPITLSYINSNNSSRYKKLSFILGIMSSFTIIIIFTSLLQTLSFNIPIVSSFYIIVIGLSLLGIIQISVISLHNNQNSTFVTTNIINNYITGFIIGINCASCSTPIIASITLWTSTLQENFTSKAYILCYLLGYIIPIVTLVNATLNYANAKWLQIKDHWGNIIPITGSFMVGLGTLSLLNNIFL